MSDVDIPKIGKVPKPALIAVGAVTAGFIGYRWYQSRQDAADSTTDTTTDPMDTTAIDPTTGLPYDAVDPATGLPYSSDSGSSYAPYGYDPVTGEPLSSDPGVDSGYGFTGTTDSQWSQYAAQQLQQSDTWSYTDIVTALGNYLGQRPLTALQQQIVQAAIAVAGNPPVGYYTVVPGGDVPITSAPSGLRVVSTTSTTANLSWTPLAGAGYYRIYRSGVSTNVGATDGGNSTISIGGLAPNTSYTFYIAADTTTGEPGPKSAGVTGKTAAVTLKAPATPKVSSITTTSAKLTTTAVSGATGYNWYINNVAHGHSDAPSYTASGLAKGKKYTTKVTADNASQAPGPASGTATFTTKTK